MRYGSKKIGPGRPQLPPQLTSPKRRVDNPKKKIELPRVKLDVESVELNKEILPPVDKLKNRR